MFAAFGIAVTLLSLAVGWIDAFSNDRRKRQLEDLARRASISISHDPLAMKNYWVGVIVLLIWMFTVIGIATYQDLALQRFSVGELIAEAFLVTFGMLAGMVVAWLIPGLRIWWYRRTLDEIHPRVRGHWVLASLASPAIVGLTAFVFGVLPDTRSELRGFLLGVSVGALIVPMMAHLIVLAGTVFVAESRTLSRIAFTFAILGALLSLA